VSKPPDIARLPWDQPRSHAWTTQHQRALVIGYLKGYVASRNWGQSWEVAERFMDSGVNVHVATGPTGPPQERTFHQRPGMPILVLAVLRSKDNERFECGLHFPRGTDTDVGEIAVKLGLAARSFDALHREVPWAY
jgi:hypothetical protein